MFDVLENHSGKICVVLVGATLAGGAVLVFGAPAFAAAYVTVHAVELFTVGAAVGAVASGSSYIRRENTNRNVRLQHQNVQERDGRLALTSNALREEYTMQATVSFEDTNISLAVDPRETQERVAALEAENRAKDVRLERVERILKTALRGMAQREIDDESESYLAGNYSDSDSSAEESKQPLLSEQNMFQRRTVRVPMEVAANDVVNQREAGVHRRRFGANNSFN